MSSERRRRFWRNNKRDTCYYCNRSVSRNLPENHKNKATIDHILPLSLGGTWALKNMVLCCYLCNHKKGNKYENFQV